MFGVFGLDNDTETMHSGTITKIERQKRIKDRYNLFIDEQFAFSVHEDILIKHRLVKGTVISIDDFKVIIHAQEKQQAYLDAIRLLAVRLRSEHELKVRLKQKGYEPNISAITIERLRQEKYVDDMLFAEQLTMQRIRSQKKGRHWVKQELQHKGLQSQHIVHALEKVDEETEYRHAFDLVFKRYRTEFAEDSVKARRKAMGFLMRRGYSSSLVSRVMRDLVQAYGAANEDELDNNEGEFEEY
ncbi:RecX family transcriptional regulator [Paenibacillus sp. UNC451MF]|uniref:RecX family transcriptional regulator n=1 Tax=Paenibacillus sp. UNC451MF TaxID=1449063 RepID=UPI000A782109|nr:RecX family transcriptional regulator [Paenibacillus sp. UNC451MF]